MNRRLPIFPRRHLPIPWGAFLLLAMAASAGAATHDVDFSIFLPEAERVYLAGSFNDWDVSDATRMVNEDGVWKITVPLDEGTHAYRFKAEGEAVSGDGWTLDWKSSRQTRKQRNRINSALVVPDDLDAFRSRQQRARETDQGIEIPLFYDRQPDEDAAYRLGGYASHSLQDVPPAGDWKLPGFTGERPLYALVEISDSQFLAAIDRKSSGDATYNHAFFDRNGNGDLTDDPPIDGDVRGYSEGSYFNCSFPAIDVQIESGGRRLPYTLSLRLSGTMPGKDADSRPGSNNLRNIRLLSSPQCAYLGEFALGGTGYRIAICDSTGNGTFDDQASLPEGTRYGDGSLYARGDSFYITTADRINSSDGLLFGGFLSLGDRLFTVRVDIPEGRLLLEPRLKDVGTLELPAPLSSMSMLSASGDDALMLAHTGKRAAVPADTWRLLSYQLVKTDEWGDEWILQARGSEDAPCVAVSPNGSAALPLGEPLRASVDIPDYALQQAVAKGSLRMSLAILGNAKERISDLRRASGTNTQHKMAPRDPNRPEAAAYRIIKPDGERVASGSFEYG